MVHGGRRAERFCIGQERVVMQPMEKRKIRKKTILSWVLTLAAILTAYTCRIVGKVGEAFQTLSLIRTVIYLAFFMTWGVLLGIRIQQKEIRKYMLGADFLIVFWTLTRTIKFYIVQTPFGLRLMWYLYYLPMLFLPMLALLVALFIGKPDDHRLSKWSYILWIIPGVLFAFVMTNDFHQLVFTFPADLSRHLWSDAEYGYNFLFRVINLWEAFCPIAALLIMLVRCRISGMRKYFWLPALPLALSVLYMALYGFGFHWFFFLFGDMTIVQSLLMVATLEACIFLGLIQSNTYYAELFDGSVDCSAQIVDHDYEVRYASRDAKPIAKEQMMAARQAPLHLGDGIILHTMGISGGYAVWTEDNSKLLTLSEELNDLKEELQDRSSLLRYEYDREKRRREIEEQNRMHDLLQVATQKQIDKIALLVTAYQRVEKASEASQTILAKIAVLCSFIKRRKHLTLLVYKDYDIPLAELKAAFAESLQTLELLGVSHSLFVDAQMILNGSDATTLYDFFEDVVEAGLDSLRSLNVRLVRLNGSLRIVISMGCAADLSPLEKAYPGGEFDRDEDEWTCLLVLNEGGEVE